MLRSIYIHQQPEWPNFRWNSDTIVRELAEVRFKQGLLLGHMESIGFDLRQEAMLGALTEEVVKSSDIEGEVLASSQVRSSVARRLGMDVAGLVPSDRHVDGMVDMLLDATQGYDWPLTEERLLGWHAALFPTGYSNLMRIRAGSGGMSIPVRCKSFQGRWEESEFTLRPRVRTVLPRRSSIFWIGSTLNRKSTRWLGQGWPTFGS